MYFGASIINQLLGFTKKETFLWGYWIVTPSLIFVETTV